jgi:GT2 family glycosyltransferase
MNLMGPERIVVLGFLSHFPVAGVAWQTVHYLVGLRRLGYEVFYVEAHGCTPSKLMRSETDDGARRAAEYIAGVMERFDLGGSWAYHARYPESRYFGLSEGGLRGLFESAALVINLHGSHLPEPEYLANGRLVYLETDPVDVQMDLYHGRRETQAYLEPHCAFFSFGENLGRADCRVPTSDRFRFLPTRQPVVLDFWSGGEGTEPTTFTTIGNWQQPWREVLFEGEVYRWTKHLEFRKILGLPRRVKQEFELALASCDEADQRLLTERGWRYRPASEVSGDLDVYRRYIVDSRGELTVAKDQNVRLRSGWFSDRGATYLAAGRPVVTQETGFSNILPTGEGLFGFSDLAGAVAAVEAINGDYGRHVRGARELAREYFGHEVVLGRLLGELGLGRGVGRGHGDRASGLPGDLRVMPVSRWPTRLPVRTREVAMALPVPVVGAGREGGGVRCSVVMVTRDALPFTRLCLTVLMGSGWCAGDELVVVDNGSTDGTVEFLREVGRLNGSVRVALNDGNRGFSVATNQGLRAATGEVLILLNNDTLPLPGWREGLVRWLSDATVGLVGPVTNRTCNEAEIESPYVTFGELERFALERARAHRGEGRDVRMLAMFCVGMRREVLERVGFLDERFEVGMFEDDDYSRRVEGAGYRRVCAEDVFVHHFGQASFGELCEGGHYDRVQSLNRDRFEAKWGVAWEPHGRRVTPEYRNLRARVVRRVTEHVAPGQGVLVISKGDDELVTFEGWRGWHFPRGADGGYASVYPADGDEAVLQLEAQRAMGARYLVIPRPAFWWLEFYGSLARHLEGRCRRVVQDEEACVIFELGGVDE